MRMIGFHLCFSSMFLYLKCNMLSPETTIEFFGIQVEITTKMISDLNSPTTTKTKKKTLLISQNLKLESGILLRF